MSANAKFYIGHRVLRMQVMGLDNRLATAPELDRMQGLLRDAMQSGAAGMSTGLIYVPGCYADTEEVVALARATAPYNGVYTVTAPNMPEAEGLSVSRFAALQGRDPWECFFELMDATKGTAKCVYATMREEDLWEIIQSPYCVVGTDGYNNSWASKGHPRDSATFPHAINYYVKDKKILTLEQMIHKMTGLTAERLLVPNKGLLKAGYDADVLIFDYDRLKDLSTYDDPNRLTEGMDYVIVGGQVVYHDMKFTGVYPGKFVAHKA